MEELCGYVYRVCIHCSIFTLGTYDKTPTYGKLASKVRHESYHTMLHISTLSHVLRGFLEMCTFMPRIFSLDFFTLLLQQKVKVKVSRALVIAPQVDTAITEVLRYMARTKQRCIYLPYTIPAVAGTHLPTPRGWRVE